VLERHLIAPAEHDEPAQRYTRGDGPELEAKPLADADHAERLPGTEAVGRLGAQVDAARAGEHVAALEHENVVAHHRLTTERQMRQRGTLSGLLVAEHCPRAAVGHERAGVEALSWARCGT
jgi:hypothetical protein